MLADYASVNKAGRYEMKKLLLAAAIAVAVSFSLTQYGGFQPDKTAGPRSDRTLASAFESRISNIRIEGHGVVTRILSDDLEGGRHQRFIITSDSGHTVLVAHNIDLAPRLGSLRVGDEVLFNGEYEWNPKGGVIHWTHRDPAGSHPAGWIKHRGRTYE